MGMPISSYTILKALAERRDTFETETALRALAPFKLFAFIIHDPEVHSEFHHVLEREFDRLDLVTGPHLLFFALVDPPAEWLRQGRRRAYHRYLSTHNWETAELLNPENAILSPDKSNTAFSLANALRIPIEDLPCIVVTEDFHLNRFLWFKTSGLHIEEQLIRLGFFAARGRKPMPESSDDWSEINLCSSHGEERLDDSLAKALSDALSFIFAGADAGVRNRWMQQEALNHARDTLARLYFTVSHLKTSFKESANEEVDRLCVCLVSFLAQLNTRQHLSPDEFVVIPRELLEPDSFQILRTAHKVVDLLVSYQIDKPVLVERETFDFTPGVVCLAKVFEKEANLSVVHWARRELGVSLPQYFNKPQPGIKATVVPSIPGGREIDLNMGRRGKWLPPSIGQSELACQELSRARLPDNWNITEWRLLLTLWKKVREKRNEAAHTEIMNEASLREVQRALQQMAENRLFEKFFYMKNEYRGGD